MYTVYRIRRYDEKRSVDGASRNRPSKSNGVIIHTIIPTKVYYPRSLHNVVYSLECT